MTDKEILEKAIRKAVRNGYKIQEKDGDKDMTEFVMANFDEFIENLFDIPSVNTVIFSHDFAKVFWGEEEVCYDCGQILEADEGDGLMCKNCCEHAGWDDNLGDADGQSAWQYHLQKMVISENPIKYLEEFIK